jgi:hypothetical protein
MGNTRKVIIFRYNQIITVIFNDPIMDKASSSNNFYLGREGKNGIASSRILNRLFKEPNARSTVTLRDECLRLNNSFSFCTGLLPTHSSGTSHRDKEAENPVWLHIRHQLGGTCLSYKDMYVRYTSHYIYWVSINELLKFYCTFEDMKTIWAF